MKTGFYAVQNFSFILFLTTGSLLMAQPPVAPVKPVVDTHFGTQVTDHYRYLEDFKNPDVQAWVKQQADYAEKSLATIPGRGKLLERIKELDAGKPFRRATRFSQYQLLVPDRCGDLFF